MEINLSLRIYLIANAIVFAGFYILNFWSVEDTDIIIYLSFFSLLFSLPALIFLAIFFAMVPDSRAKVSGMWKRLMVFSGFLGSTPGGFLMLIDGINSFYFYLVLLGVISAWLAILLQRHSIHQFFKSVLQ